MSMDRERESFVQGRRGFLRGIVTSPLAGALPAAGGPPDPALAAVAAYQRAQAAWRAACAAADASGLPDREGDAEDLAFDAKMRALDGMYLIQPTTRAGLHAQIEAFLLEDADFLADGDGAHRGALAILRSAAALMAEVRS